MPYLNSELCVNKCQFNLNNINRGPLATPNQSHPEPPRGNIYTSQQNKLYN